MYQLSEYVKDAIKMRLGKESNIKSCTFSNNIESSLSFRTKLLNTAKIPIANLRIEESTLITIEAWFNKTEVTNIHYILTDKNLMEHDKGPDVTCMGSVLWIGSEKSKLFNLTIKKLLPFLKKICYVGPVSLSVLIDGDKVYAVSILTTLGYDYSFIMFEIMSNKLYDFISKLEQGKMEEIKYKSTFGIAFDLCVLPFPFEMIKSSFDETSITGLDHNGLKHFWGYDIEKTDDAYCTVGKGGRIGVVTARGDDKDTFSSYRESRRRAFRTINNIKAEGLMYRSDIGWKFESTKRILEDKGWL